jgi:hypothetical protein
MFCFFEPAQAESDNAQHFLMGQQFFLRRLRALLNGPQPRPFLSLWPMEI